MFYIYCYENKVNGKIYIGQTTNLSKRDSHHSSGHGIKDNVSVDSAIVKYGRDNFNFWTILIVDTQDQANREEIYWISEMRNQLGRNMIYNISDGGNNKPIGWSGKERPKETREKISASLKGQSAPWVSEANKKRGTNPSFNHKGKTWKLINGKRKWIEA